MVTFAASGSLSDTDLAESTNHNQPHPSTPMDLDDATAAHRWSSQDLPRPLASAASLFTASRIRRRRRRQPPVPTPQPLLDRSHSFGATDAPGCLSSSRLIHSAWPPAPVGGCQSSSSRSSSCGSRSRRSSLSTYSSLTPPHWSAHTTPESSPRHSPAHRPRRLSRPVPGGGRSRRSSFCLPDPVAFVVDPAWAPSSSSSSKTSSAPGSLQSSPEKKTPPQPPPPPTRTATPGRSCAAARRIQWHPVPPPVYPALADPPPLPPPLSASTPRTRGLVRRPCSLANLRAWQRLCAHFHPQQLREYHLTPPALWSIDHQQPQPVDQLGQTARLASPVHPSLSTTEFWTYHHPPNQQSLLAAVRGRSLDARLALLLVAQASLAVSALHATGLAHGSIHSLPFVLSSTRTSHNSQTRIWLRDLDCAGSAGLRLPTAVCVDPSNAPPERLELGVLWNAQKADLWGLGAMLWRLLLGRSFWTNQQGFPLDAVWQSERFAELSLQSKSHVQLRHGQPPAQLGVRTSTWAQRDLQACGGPFSPIAQEALVKLLLGTLTTEPDRRLSASTIHKLCCEAWTQLQADAANSTTGSPSLSPSHHHHHQPEPTLLSLRRALTLTPPTAPSAPVPGAADQDPSADSSKGLRPQAWPTEPSGMDTESSLSIAIPDNQQL